MPRLTGAVWYLNRYHDPEPLLFVEIARREHLGLSHAELWRRVFGASPPRDAPVLRGRRTYTWIYRHPPGPTGPGTIIEGISVRFQWPAKRTQRGIVLPTSTTGDGRVEFAHPAGFRAWFRDPRTPLPDVPVFPERERALVRATAKQWKERKRKRLAAEAKAKQRARLSKRRFGKRSRRRWG